MPATKKNDYWFVFHNERLLLPKNPDVNAMLSSSHIKYLENDFVRQHRLVVLEHADIYCAELKSELSVPDNLESVSFRKALELLHPDWFAIAAKAYSIINWDKNHHYCGRCGKLTTQTPDTFEKKCEHCTLHFYPRISPSIIVLIHRQDQVIMARSPHFPPGVYGLIAGYVEAGESAEEAVKREIMEEIGIKVKNLKYFHSQSWPFPDSLMLAFTAEYASGDLNINHTEIEDAGWYRYDNLPGRPSTKLSIASQLLDDFIATQRQHAAK